MTPRPTRAEIDAARSPAGGWTRDQLAEWGIPWPPPSGWKRRLELEADEKVSSETAHVPAHEIPQTSL